LYQDRRFSSVEFERLPGSARNPADSPSRLIDYQGCGVTFFWLTSLPKALVTLRLTTKLAIPSHPV
jgi:hypothetical protein